MLPYLRLFLLMCRADYLAFTDNKPYRWVRPQASYRYTARACCQSTGLIKGQYWVTNCQKPMWRTPQCIVFITHAYMCVCVCMCIYVCVYVHIYIA